MKKRKNKLSSPIFEDSKNVKMATVPQSINAER